MKRAPKINNYGGLKIKYFDNETFHFDKNTATTCQQRGE